MTHDFDRLHPGVLQRDFGAVAVRGNLRLALTELHQIIACNSQLTNSSPSARRSEEQLHGTHHTPPGLFLERRAGVRELTSNRQTRRNCAAVAAEAVVVGGAAVALLVAGKLQAHAEI